MTSGVRLGKFTLDAPADLTRVTALPETLDDAGMGAVGGGGPGLLLGGGVSALGSALFDVFDDGMASFAQDGTQHGEVLPAVGSFGVRTRDGGLDYWTRSWAGDTAVLAGGAQTTVRGAEVGVDSPLGSGLRLGASVAPEVVGLGGACRSPAPDSRGPATRFGAAGAGSASTSGRVFRRAGIGPIR